MKVDVFPSQKWLHHILHSTLQIRGSPRERCSATIVCHIWVDVNKIREELGGTEWTISLPAEVAGLDFGSVTGSTEGLSVIGR